MFLGVPEDRVGRERTVTSKPRLVQHAFGDDDPLNLARALADLQELGVPEEPLDRVFARVSVSSEDLDRFAGHPRGGLGGEELRDGRFPGVGPAFRAQARGIVDQEAGRVDGRGHVGDLLPDRAELSDEDAEGPPLTGVRAGLVESPTGDPDPHGSDPDPASFQRDHEIPEALSLFSQTLGGVHPAVVEVDLAGVGAPEAELVLLLPDGEARRIRFDDERRDPPVVCSSSERRPSMYLSN